MQFRHFTRNSPGMDEDITGCSAAAKAAGITASPATPAIRLVRMIRLPSCLSG
ncbi:MAG: hypothetical protein JXR37_31605 [Kiritimatiellae bacterium]|nr:hypothetical protein [Kiritimatiellia bacterium]